MPTNPTSLSKTISLVLRHQPWLFELELDPEGWVPLEALLAGLRKQRAQWRDLTAEDVERLLAAADKKRFEIRGGRIRAFYGHSVPMLLAKEPAQPPALLYHGTSPKAAKAIAQTGLRPMRRQYVHLSADLETAVLVGRRKAPQPVILAVDALRAHADGVRFYLGNEKVWLAGEVPPEYLSEAKQPTSAE